MRVELIVTCVVFLSRRDFLIVTIGGSFLLCFIQVFLRFSTMMCSTEHAPARMGSWTGQKCLPTEQ